jgi:hypothetical protein
MTADMTGLFRRFTEDMTGGLRAAAVEVRAMLDRGRLPPDLAGQLVEMERALAGAGYATQCEGRRSGRRGMDRDPCGGLPVSGPARIGARPE